MPAIGYGDRHPALGVAVFQEMVAPALGRDQQFADLGRPEHLAAIEADIGPVRSGVVGDDAAEGVDELAAVGRVPARRRELVEVDGVAGEDILLARAVIDRDRADRVAIGVLQMAHRRLVVGIVRQAEHQADLGLVRESAGDEFGARRAPVVADVAEEQAGALDGDVDPGDRADLLVPIHGNVDPAQLVVGFQDF